jgi:pyruvate decarboxylase
VKNKTEVSKLLDDLKFARAEKIQLVEVVMHKFDAPRALRVTTGFKGSWEA